MPTPLGCGSEMSGIKCDVGDPQMVSEVHGYFIILFPLFDLFINGYISVGNALMRLLWLYDNNVSDQHCMSYKLASVVHWTCIQNEVL